MTLTVTDGEFYLADIDGEQTLHADKRGAIAQAGDNIDAIDNGDDAVTRVEVGDDWRIKEITPREIYKTLLEEQG